jgi:hypothetical protein
MAKQSYNEYCLYNREYQELKDLILKKQEEYNKKHPIFKIKGDASISNPWKK